MWLPTKLQMQTEMLPALAQCCSRCPHVQHMLLIVARGAPLPRAMWETFSDLRAGIEAIAANSIPMLLPWPETPDSVSCAALIRASELYRDACRSSAEWRHYLEFQPLLRELRNGDFVLVPRSPPIPHPP